MVYISMPTFIGVHMILTDFYRSTVQFLQCLLSSVAPESGLMVDNEGKKFEIQVCRLLENAFFSGFSGNIRVYTYMQVSFMLVCKCLNQRVRRIGEQNGKAFNGVSKKKKIKKKNMKRSSSITQFKIQFLLLFTSCRKCLEKSLIGHAYVDTYTNFFNITHPPTQLSVIRLYIFNFKKQTNKKKTNSKKAKKTKKEKRIYLGNGFKKINLPLPG